jgi:hypothetical protein
MRSTHRKTKSWSETAKLHGIVTAEGKPNKGLAYQIAVNGFEPSEHETLIRIGMPCLCDGCKKAQRKARRAAHQDLFDMSINDLRDALINRQPMPPINYSRKNMTAFVRACKGGAS